MRRKETIYCHALGIIRFFSYCIHLIPRPFYFPWFIVARRFPFPVECCLHSSQHICTASAYLKGYGNSFKSYILHQVKMPSQRWLHTSLKYYQLRILASNRKWKTGLVVRAHCLAWNKVDTHKEWNYANNFENLRFMYQLQDSRLLINCKHNSNLFTHIEILNHIFAKL